MIQMKFQTKFAVLGAAALVITVSTGPVQAAIDIDAAQALFKSNDCTKCHAVDKTKKGPPLTKIAAKYKGKAEGQSSVLKQMTEGKKVKLADGTEQDHKVIDTKDQKDMKNLADWILSH